METRVSNSQSTLLLLLLLHHRPHHHHQVSSLSELKPHQFFQTLLNIKLKGSPLLEPNPVLGLQGHNAMLFMLS